MQVDLLNMIEIDVLKERVREGVTHSFLYSRISNHRSSLLIPSVDIRIATEARNIKFVAEGLNS